MGQNRFGKNFIIPIQRDDVVLHHEGKQVVLVFGVKLAGILAEQRRNVERRYDGDQTNLDGFARMRSFAITAAFGRKIYDDSAGFHARNLRFIGDTQAVN